MMLSVIASVINASGSVPVGEARGLSAPGHGDRAHRGDAEGRAVWPRGSLRTGTARAMIVSASSVSSLLAIGPRSRPISPNSLMTAVRANAGSRRMRDISGLATAESR
jgi:hypothetical protein